MKQLVFATGNGEKFVTAQHACEKYGIALAQKDLPVDEIQEEDSERIARDKAAKAFEFAKEPVVITDDSWAFLGLKGFPGAYMHSMNVWFTPEDFLRLTAPLKDRRVVLTQYLVYHDSSKQKVFTIQTEGKLLSEIRGTTEHACHTLITMPGDNGLSIAEAFEQAGDKSSRVSAKIWQDFAAWFTAPAEL